MVAAMMSTKTWLVVIFILFVIIVVMLGFLITLPTSKPSPDIIAATSTTEEEAPPPTEEEESEKPLSSRVVVTSPQAKQLLGHMFTVAGVAPGPWFFEAQFPMQVRDMEGNVVGRATATAQGEWMTTELVTFTATMQIDATFHGDAKLILIKDNPSGLPEHDDAVEIPITID
ncbi:hypothetical protein C4568_03980 [Candidatus Parcubacteria bacterium]|nr:MAG: hypothetical protein C4568_03980 [Candidatus Parcubacteria bacterium]